MKHSQKGFVAPLLITIAVLMIGGVYIYSQKIQKQSLEVPASIPVIVDTAQNSSTLGIKIYSISQSSGAVGARLTIKGNFSEHNYGGPEYATQVVIKNSNGKKIVVELMPDNNTATFTIQSKMCAVNLGGKGGSCPSASTVIITPGQYLVYFENTFLNLKSNSVSFTIIPANDQPRINSVTPNPVSGGSTVSIDNANSTTKVSSTSSGIKIYSISKSSSPVETKLTLKIGFTNDIYRGPEYATQVLIKKDSGETAVVDAVADFDTVTFAIQKNMCSVNLGGRDDSCPTDKIVTMSPGYYIIYFENTYFQPNIISNGVKFTLTSDSGSIVTITPSPTESVSTNPLVKATNQQTAGNQRIIVLLINYLDSDNPPVTKEWLQDRIFNGPFHKFYDEQSYHQISFTGNIYGWITLQKKDDNLSSATCLVSNSLMSKQSQPEILNYLTQNNIDLSNYDGLYLIVNTPNTGPCSWGIKSSQVVGGKTYNLYVSEVPISNSSNLQQTSAPYPMTSLEASLIHETGHNLGLGHANGWDCNDKIISGDCQEIGYGGLFDVMGTAHYSFQFGAYFKDILGWIKPERKLIITKSGTYTINPIEADSGIATAVIQPAGTSFPLYYLELRKNTGFDSYINKYPYNERGLVVSWPQQGKSYRSLNMLPVAHDRSSSNAWVYNLVGKTLNASVDNPNPSSFYDEKSGVTIGPVTSVGTDSITFIVSMRD